MYNEIHTEGIEERAAAPAIARFLAAWTQLNERFGFVPLAPFEPEGLGAVGEDMLVLVPVDDDNFVYAYYGPQVAAASGLDMTGRTVGDFPGPSGTFLRDVYARALAENRPLFVLNRSPFSAHVHVWERLVLPCRDRDGSNVLIVYCKPREFRHDLYAAAFEASHDAIVALRFMRDPTGEIVDGEIIAANRRAAKIAGLTVDDLVTRAVLGVYPGIKETGIWDMYLRVAASRKTERIEVTLDVDGRTVWFEIAIAPLGDGVLASFNNITARKSAESEVEMRAMEFAAANEALNAEVARRKELEAELLRLATTDELTGILNRRALTDAVARGLASAARYGHALSIVALDLDFFKRVNDTFGHGGGDEVLKAAAAILRHGCREDVDAIGRLGGEEFVAVLPHTNLDGTATLAERLRVTMAQAVVRHEGRDIRFTASFGVAAWDGREGLDKLLSRADDALYRAKAAGRNVVVIDTGEGAFVTMRANEAPLAPEAAPQGMPPPKARTRRGTRPRAKASPI